MLKTLAFGILISLTGCCRYCIHSKSFALHHTDLFQQVEKASLSCVFTPFPDLNDHWWDFFEDPQLSRLIEVSLSCHPNIQLARERIEHAYQEALIARSQLFPHLFASGDFRRQKVSEFGLNFFPGEPTVFSLTTLKLTTSVYELDIWQKNRSLFYAALDEVHAEIADYSEAALLLSTTLASVYFDLQMNLARLDLNRQRLDAKEELFSLLKQQFYMGIISEYRLYETDSEIQVLRDFIYQIEGWIEMDRHALAALAGNVSCGEGELFDPLRARFDGPFPLPTTLPIDLLARRPEITAQLWHIESACYKARAAKARFYPRIDLLAFIGVQSFRIDKLFTNQALIALGEATGVLPLFTAGKLKAELGAAGEDIEIAIQEYNKKVLNAVQEVSDALSNLVFADKRRKAYAASIEDAERLFDLVEQRVANGVINKIILLNSRDNVLFQKDQATEVELVRFQAAVDLIRSIGGGYIAATECP